MHGTPNSRSDHPTPVDFSARWEQVLAAGVRAQQLISGCVATGGTAAALYAHHRYSMDTDHLISDLRDRYDSVRESLEASSDWKTARLQPPVLILGSIGGVDVGFRQMRRSAPVETAKHDTLAGPLTIPTLDELIGMKAYLAYSRSATRDYVDFAALTSCANTDGVVTSLLRSDERYGDLQTQSASLEIAKTLAQPEPYDLDSIELNDYKGIQPPWNDWQTVVDTCKRFGLLLAESLV